MVLFVAIFSVLAAAFASEAARLTRLLKLAREQIDAMGARLRAVPPQLPAPVRQYECRREHLGLLWFLTFTIQEDGLQVTRVSSGLPHCARCVCPLKLEGGLKEEWVCVGCEARHPGANADLNSTDALLSACLVEFFSRHPDFVAAPGLSAPKFTPPVRRAPAPTPVPRHHGGVFATRRKIKRVLI